MAIEINTDRINARINRAWASTNEALSTQFKAEIEAVQWPWPNATARRNGQVVTSPRDIVDLGELRDSQSLTQIDPNAYEHRWDAPHAAAVRLGYRTRNGRSIPGRDWVSAGLQNFDVAQEMSKRL
jgi:hypothetical protein